MPILATDIKLMKSERMHDEDDGGGRMSGDEIVDGVSNGLFPDISQLDRTYGRLNLRKLFPAVLSADTDTFLGSHLIVSTPPADTTVRTTLFRSGSTDSAWVDEHLDAQDKIESYTTLGPLSPMRLVGTHYEGQRALLTYQRVDAAEPVAGEIFTLYNEGAGLKQYVRIDAVAATSATYEDNDGPFVRTELYLTISDPLEIDFVANQPQRNSDTSATKVHRTNAISAIEYYGVSTLADPAAFDSREIVVSDYKEALLPATQSEEALLDKPAGNSCAHSIDAGSREVAISQVENTQSFEITAMNRGYIYVNQIVPKPAPGTLEIAFRAMDKWYKIADESGSGQLTGAGSGVINYTTGSVSLTLAEMPDVGTRIIFGAGSGNDFEVENDALIDPPEYHYTVAHAPIKGSTISITFESDGASKTITDDGNGNLVGDGSGAIDYAAGEIRFSPTFLPDPGESPVIAYTQLTKTSETFPAVVPVAGELSVTLAQQPEPGTVKVVYKVGRQDGRRGVLYDSLAEGLSLGTYADSMQEFIDVDPTVDVPLREVTVDTQFSYSYRRWVKIGTHRVTHPSGSYPVADWGWDTYLSASTPITTDITISYSAAGAAETAHTENIPPATIKIDLTPHSVKSVVPGSVEFIIAGHHYIDIEGVIHRDVDPGTGVGTVTGVIDYTTGLVVLASWAVGAPAVSVTSLLLELYPWSVSRYAGYAAVAPLKSASFTIAATAANGALFTGSADSNGELVGDYLRGEIDIESGVYELDFGELLLDADLTAEDKAEAWYDPADIDGDGCIWRPLPVLPSTIRYNCVSYVYMPLSSDILGIDPVRLPMDGRVPIFAVGRVVVIHHLQETPIPTPVDGQVVDTGRERLTWVKLYDAAGDPVPTAQYTVDLDAGTVTLDDVSGLTAPLSLQDQIAEMALINDLQINGTLGLTRALSHDYPAGAYVSTALLLGDLFARVTNVFEQTTWTGVWSDDLIGSAPLASFNHTAFPITINNNGSTQERWIAKFTSSTTFEVFGEFSGLVGTGDTSTDCAPINPASGAPYFVLPAGGWGAGWATGNLIRINTIAANKPVWVARTILQSEAYSGTDLFCLELRGDVDTP